MTVADAAPQRLTRTLREAAPILGIGETSAYKLARSGALRTIRVGRKILVPLSAIEEFLNGQPNSGEK